MADDFVWVDPDFDDDETDNTCPECQGFGDVGDQECFMCEGTGVLEL